MLQLRRVDLSHDDLCTGLGFHSKTRKRLGLRYIDISRLEFAKEGK
jgi:hypothetical protein